MILKYKLNTINCEQEVSMPIGCKILSIQMQENKPVMWALGNSDRHESVVIKMYGTGLPIQGQVNDEIYLGTLQGYDGIVRHYFKSNEQKKYCGAI